MRRRILILLLMIAAFGGSRDVIACGDKFIVVSRGTRFQRPASHRPAAILIYALPSSRLPQTLDNMTIAATLRKAGFRPTAVADESEFEEALAQGGWDLVVADVAHARAVTRRLGSAGSTVVLPLVYDATSAEVKRAKDEFQRVLRSPAKSQSVLQAIDDALARRSKTSN